MGTTVCAYDADGRLCWETIVLSTSRQVGKSWLLRDLCLWRMHQAARFGEPQDDLGGSDVEHRPVGWIRRHQAGMRQSLTGDRETAQRGEYDQRHPPNGRVHRTCLRARRDCRSANAPIAATPTIDPIRIQTPPEPPPDASSVASSADTAVDAVSSDAEVAEVVPAV